jgi:hypothetical protein
MADILGGFSVNQGTGAGTTVISGNPAVLHSLWQPAGTAAGTLDMYDSATAAGTASTNLKFSHVYTTASGVPLILDYQFKNGIVAVTSGSGTVEIASL